MMTNRKHLIAAHFNAAHAYDDAARIQQRCAQLLAEHIRHRFSHTSPRNILEFGCGTGLLTQALVQAFPHAEFHITDLSPAMLERTQARLTQLAQQNSISLPTIHFYQMDGESPQPHPHAGFDLITSSLCLQWFENRATAFSALASHLRPAGAIMVSTLLQDSLAEWRESCDATAIPCGVPAYPSLEQLQSEWPAHGTGHWDAIALQDPTPSARSFLTGLRLIGASLPHTGHTPRHGIRLRRAMTWFDNHHTHVTYHIGFGSFYKEQ